MTFVQNQEITMPENIGYITELIASPCYMGLSHTVFGPNGMDLLCLVLYLTLTCSCELLLCVMVTKKPWL